MRRRTSRCRGSMRRSRSQPHNQVNDVTKDNCHGGHGSGGWGSGGGSSTSSSTSAGGGGDYYSHQRGEDTRLSLYSTSSSATTTSSTHSTSSSSNECESNNWTNNIDNANHRVVLGEAIWDHVTLQPDELAFTVGEVVYICDWSHPEIWFGTCKDRSGWFPASHLRLLANQNLDTASNDSNWNTEQQGGFRLSVLQELLSTERDYLSLLRNVVQGFLRQARRRPEMFGPERILVIFGNLEEIYALHQRFLSDLESAVSVSMGGSSASSPSSLSSSSSSGGGDTMGTGSTATGTDNMDQICVGNCFLKHEHSFEIYSDYCNNHPLSCTELSHLYKEEQFRQFFEACRLLRGMPELNLDAFLLTPVQRICKYPLQLAELVKNTPTNHPDYRSCQKALEGMRKVARVINDRKRGLEHLQSIAAWQMGIENWHGPDLLDRNSHLIHSGDILCRFIDANNNNNHNSGAGGGAVVAWTKDVTAFLFNNTLVLCKKDMIKRQHLIFKDQINLEGSRWHFLSDGKDAQFGCTVKYGWKLEGTRGTWLGTSRNREGRRGWEEAVGQLPSHLPPPSVHDRRIALTTINTGPPPTIRGSKKAMVETGPRPSGNNKTAVQPSKMWQKLNATRIISSNNSISSIKQNA